MDKKSFVKGLFTGLGISLAGLIVAGGVIACNQKPVTTTPVVNKAEVVDERGSFLESPKKANATGWADLRGRKFKYNGNPFPSNVNSYMETTDGRYHSHVIGKLTKDGVVYEFNTIFLLKSSSSTQIRFDTADTRDGVSYYAMYNSAWRDNFSKEIEFLDIAYPYSFGPLSPWLTAFNALFDEVPVGPQYELTATGNHCAYEYVNNNDGTGSVEVTPDAGYTLLDNDVPASWVVSDLSGATLTWFSADPDTGKVVYSVSGASSNGWSATFNARPSSTQTIVYNLSHCTATPLNVPYGDLDTHYFVRITPDEGYSLKHVTPSYTGLVDTNHLYDWVYVNQDDVIDIGFNLVEVNPSVTCSAIQKVESDLSGLEHCSLLDVNPSPLVGYESRWRFVPDDGYNFLEGLTSPSRSVNGVSSVAWSTEYGIGETLGKTILVCDATPSQTTISFDVEASAGIPVTSVLDNLDGKPLAYTEDSPVYWVNDNYRRSVTYNAMRGYRFVSPYVRVNVNAGISYTTSNNDHTLVVEYWNVPTGAGVNQLTIYPQLHIDVEAMGWGSTNVNFGNDWRPIQYVDNTAEYYTGSYMESNVLDFDSIVFSANGSMYDELKLVYKVIGSNKFFVDGVDLNADGHLSEFKYFDHMEFRNSTTGESVIACSTKAMIVTANNVTTVEIYPQELYWGNVQNGIISIYYDDGTTYDTATGVGLNLTATYILLNGGNVTGGSSIGNTGNVGFGGTYDPFVLISSAIGTATGFLGYMVLPGLTIGMLMLIPMIITLIIVVFKLVKK